ncbi:MAG: translocation/assembly module TamB domain-containing protein, partial [Myxococcota bacterium]
LPGGSVYLKEREFELQRGDVLFVDPFTFDPDVDILLATDVRSREEEYDIAYRISGTYNDWRAETRSDPNLPQADVNALLLFG